MGRILGQDPLTSRFPAEPVEAIAPVEGGIVLSAQA